MFSVTYIGRCWAEIVSKILSNSEILFIYLKRAASSLFRKPCLSKCCWFLNHTWGILLFFVTAELGCWHGLFPWWLIWQRICMQCRRPGYNPWVGKISGYLLYILVWRIPWTEESGGLQSMGSQSQK